MHPLKAAVLHHKLDEFSALATQEGALSDPALRSDLIRIAREMGNVFTVSRVARIVSHIENHDEARSLLRQQLVAMAQNWLGGGTPKDSARRVWLQLTEGTIEAFSKDKPDFALSEERQQDLRFLIAMSGVQSEQELVALVGGQ